MTNQPQRPDDVLAAFGMTFDSNGNMQINNSELQRYLAMDTEAMAAAKRLEARRQEIARMDREIHRLENDCEDERVKMVRYKIALRELQQEAD